MPSPANFSDRFALCPPPNLTFPVAPLRSLDSEAPIVGYGQPLTCPAELDALKASVGRREREQLANVATDRPTVPAPFATLPPAATFRPAPPLPPSDDVSTLVPPRFRDANTAPEGLVGR